MAKNYYALYAPYGIQTYTMIATGQPSTYLPAKKHEINGYGRMKY